MRYYVSYPIFIDCNLRCDYCWFKQSHYDTGDIGTVGITPAQWSRWRDTHLTDAEEILVEFTGGETFMPRNVKVMRDFMDNTTVERLDMLTNGIQPWPVYEAFVRDYGKRINRIGLSYHRMMLNTQQKALFHENVIRLRDAGVRVYVKELLAPQVYEEVLAARDDWKAEGITVKLADFRPPRDKHHSDGWQSFGVAQMDQEYVRTIGYPCSCRHGYKTIIIQSRWTAGEVIACWFNQVVVGNIVENTFNPNAEVVREANGVLVKGVPLTYNDSFVKQEQSQRAVPVHG